MPDATETTVRQFGLWDGAVSARSLAEVRRIDSVCFDSGGETLVWLEQRSGRGVLVVQSGSDAPRDLTTDRNVRAEVGYGGGDFTVYDGCVYFVEKDAGRIYRQPLDAGQAVAITPQFGNASSPVISPDGRWAACVHSDEDVDRIAVVPTDGSAWPQIAASGRDFYMQPRFSPDGARIAFIAWDHPNMPWDGTTLYTADVETDANGRLVVGEPQAVAGGSDVAVFQPEFTPDGGLLYVSDDSGWGRIVEHNLDTGEIKPLTPEGVEHGAPAWQQDVRLYAPVGDGGRIVAAQYERGVGRLVLIDRNSGESTPLDSLSEYTEITCVAGSNESRFAGIVGSAQIPPRLVVCDLDTGSTTIAARSSGETAATSDLAASEALSWKTAGGETAHGLFYAPASSKFEGMGKPPLIVLVHGGPTGQVKDGWKADAQFFATRGWAVLYVNYRGSTGYGRDYMLRLRGNWGLCDVEDSVSGAEFLAAEGRIDADRTVIMGGSAGGFTVLHTMCTRPEAFTAGVCLFGVANQFHLAAETHKFESRYLDTMLGPLPQAAALYHERSPEFHAEKIRRPLAIFQGEIDRVVPQAQSDAIARALEKSGVPHVYHVYEGEGHGWRKSETIEHFYNEVNRFLKQHVIYT